MNGHDWTLIIYTLCLQSAVGIYVVSRLVVWNGEGRGARMRFLWLVGGLGVSGVIASIFHLGYPLNALLTMSNLGESWLSREILLTAAFGGAGLVSLLLEQRELGNRLTRNLWAALTSLLGLGLIFVMSMIYRSTAFPAWAHISTTFSFFATAGLIGTVTVFAGQCCQKQQEEPKGMTALVLGALALLALQMMTISSHAAYLGGAGQEAQATAALLAGNWVFLFWARVAMVMVGAAVFMPWAWRRWAQKQVGSLRPVAGVMIAMVGLGELLGRVLFYATRVKIGL